MSLPSGSSMDLNLIPAGPPPPGEVPVIGGGPSLGTTTIALECVMMAIAATAVLCRVISSYPVRGRRSSGLGVADYASLAAMLLAIAQSSLVISLHDYERHQWNISVGSLTSSYFKRGFAQNLIAWPSIFCAKLAILLLYLRIFRVKHSLRWAVYGGAAWAALAYLPNIAVATYFCAAHPGEPWGFNVGMRCSQKGPLKWLVVSATMSVILDLYIFAVPIPIVMSLKMSNKKRLGVLLIFFTAFLACICAILTLVYRVRLLQTTDSLWLSAQLFICNAVENYIAIIVGSIPGCNTYYKSYIMESPLLNRMSSYFTGSRGPKSESSNTYPSKGSYRLKDSSSNNESMNTLQPVQPSQATLSRSTQRLD
ncbi:hypothetical protein McanCB56680_004643 [Microsporum canis]|uniref:Rhodopsin domain-containing protein n=1 Tax=Arthroderma otae (strain ATCC MYA-4605 / CBS 113480) TaxID=554155 RepID=C5FZR6_ARTOC|nr:conserved hypothetical protein [Microsporum canis CBS 113480]EEQ35369.1 conserved hypothetical protein [Microsporum canis CBS 113480]